MEGIPIYYVMQPSEDDSLNVYFLPPQYKSQNDLKIKDVVTHFPFLNNGSFYHFRFYTICDKDKKTWVDISNMSAKVPVVENKVLLKVLQVSRPEHTRTFCALYKHEISHDIPSKQDSRPPQHPNQPKPQPQPQRRSAPAEESKQSSANYKQNSPQNPQQQAQSKTPPPSNNSNAFDFDLLGDGGSEEVKVTVTSTKTQVKASFNNDLLQNKNSKEEEKSKLYGMSREELGALKQQKMEEAIQAQLDFANKVFKDAENAMADRDKAYDELEDGIKKWAGKNNQRNNIRALLCTLHEVVWKESEWQALGLSDLMANGQIKKHYYKALTKFHPDKNQDADYRQKYIAERVTNELNAAWDEFRKTNP